MLWMNWGAEPGAAGHGLQRRGRDLHRPLRRSGATRPTTTPTWPGPTDRMREMEHLAIGHPARRREPRRAPGALRQRREPARGSTRSARATTRTAASTPGWAGRDARLRRPTSSDRSCDPPDAGACWPRSSAGRSTRRRAPRAHDLDRLLDPAPLPAETGWCTLPDGVGYVAVRTRDARRQRGDGRLVVRLAPGRPTALPHLASAGARRELGRAPRARGRQGPLGDRPPPGRGRGRGHGPRADRVRRAERAGLVERRARRSRAWRRSSAAGPATTAAACGTRRWPTSSSTSPAASCSAAASGSAPRCARTCRDRSRRRSRSCSTPASSAGARCRDGLPRALARHCAEEYANLGALLPELYSRFGPAA